MAAIGWVYGIDTSYAQGKNFPFHSLLPNGREFVINRAGRAAKDGSIAVDSRYYDNMEKQRMLGLLRGSYWFFRPEVNVEKQAALFAEAMYEAGAQCQWMGAWVDVEVMKTPYEKVLQFQEVLEAEWPYQPPVWRRYWPKAFSGIYTSKHYWSHVIDAPDDMTHTPLWVADFGANRAHPRMPRGWREWTIWQYTNKAPLPGWEKGLDGNRATTKLWRQV